MFASRIPFLDEQIVSMRTTVKVSAPPVLSGLTGIEGLFYAALDLPGDEVTVKISETPGVHIQSVTGDKSGRTPASDAVKQVIGSYLEHRGMSGEMGVAVDIRLRKSNFETLGGEAPSVTAALVGVDFLVTDRLPLHALVPFIEGAVRQGFSAAGVTSLYGGVMMDAGLEERRYRKVYMPEGMYFVFAQYRWPFDRIKSIAPLERNQKTASFVLGGMTGDWSLLKHALSFGMDSLTTETTEILGHLRRIPGFIGMGTTMPAGLLYAICDNSGAAEDVKSAFEGRWPPSRHQQKPFIARLHPSGHQIY